MMTVRWGLPQAAAHAVVLCLSFAALAALARAAPNARPLAPPIISVVPEGGVAEIALAGYNPDRKRRSARTRPTVVSLPEIGSLHQLTKNYWKKAIEPKQGSPVEKGKGVADTRMRRVLYVPPPTMLPEGKWGTFQYTVSDETLESAIGIVYVLPPHLTIVSSTFGQTERLDGWTVEGDKNSAKIGHDSFRRGRLNNYVYFSEDTIEGPSAPNVKDAKRWRFVAPKKFRTNLIGAYGGSLSFDLAAFAGDFSASNLNKDVPLVRLECRTCNLNRGITLETRGINFSGSETHFDVKLLATAEWFKDPKNTLLKWPKPTACEMAEVLENISHISIAGDFTKWYETVAIDNVKVTAVADLQVPKRCICTTPGTHCQ